jgi:soluble lytic murein transglycosylase
VAKAPDKEAAPAAPAAAPSNRSLLAQAFNMGGKNWNRARLLAAESGNQIGRLIVDWRYLLDDMSGANFEAISAFLNEHPNWPRRDALTARAEKTMPDDLDPRGVVAWFSAHPPVSGNGYIRLGAALMDTGKRAEGIASIRKGWCEFTFSPFDESRIAATYANAIGPAEHRARLLKQLAREDIGGAKRQMLRVDSDTRQLANALIQLKASPATVKPLLASLPESVRNDPELIFEASRALRRRDLDDDAWTLMAKAPTAKDAMAAPERWSAERQIMARDALKMGKNELAYQLASTPALDPDAGTTFMDAEFLAGWIALQYLHRPEVAHRHFDRLAKGVTYPISVARGALLARPQR